MNGFFSFTTLWWLMLVIYIPACFALIVIVLLQKGKGTGFAGAFGVGGGSDTVFGPRVARTLPQKLTYGAAGVFMLLALLMSMISGLTARGIAPGLVDEGQTATRESIDRLFQEGGAAPPAADDAAGAVTVDEAPEAVIPGVEVEAGTAEEELVPAIPAPLEGVAVEEAAEAEPGETPDGDAAAQ